MVRCKFLQKWRLPLLPKCDCQTVKLSCHRSWLSFLPTALVGYLITGTLCRRTGLFTQCLTFDSWSQDGWRGDWWRLRKVGDSTFCFRYPSPLGSAIIPRRMCFENHYLRSYSLCNQLCWALSFRNGREADTQQLLTLWYRPLCILMLEIRRMKMTTRGVWESKRASLYPAKEQRKRIRQINSLQVNYDFPDQMEANAKAEIFLHIFPWSRTQR